MLGGGFSSITVNASAPSRPAHRYVGKTRRVLPRKRGASHNAVPVPQRRTALERAFYKTRPTFHTIRQQAHHDLKGLLFAALDAGYSTSADVAHMLDCDLSKYGAILIPNLDSIESTQKINSSNMLRPAQSVVTGHNSRGAFRAYLNIEIDGASENRAKSAWDVALCAACDKLQHRAALRDFRGHRTVYLQ